MSSFSWMVIALIVYNIIKTIKEKFQNQAREQYTANARRRLVEGVAGMLSKMAKADGHVTKDEVDVAEQFLNSFGFTRGELEMAKRVFNHAMDDGHELEYYARMLASILSTEACRLVYEMLWEIAAADGRLDPAEERLLHRAALALGFDDTMYFYYHRIHAGDFQNGGRGAGGSRGSGGEGRNRSYESHDHRYGSSYSQPREKTELEKAYSKLGCSASDSDEQVRSAYRKQAMRYHPDRLRAEGLPERMLEQANRSMAEINAAWDLIRESRKLH